METHSSAVIIEDFFYDIPNGYGSWERADRFYNYGLNGEDERISHEDKQLILYERQIMHGYKAFA